MSISEKTDSLSFSECKYSLKIITSGEGRVGKTSLLQRYVNNKFRKRYGMTIGVDFFSKYVNIDDKKITLSLWDFGGQRRFRTLLERFISGSDGALFMFELNKIETLENVADWVKILRKEKDLPIILIGTKSDLIDNLSNTDKIYIERMKEKYNFIDFIKTSSKLNINIYLAFETLIRKISRDKFE